jgi:hypothetical protein
MTQLPAQRHLLPPDDLFPIGNSLTRTARQYKSLFIECQTQHLGACDVLWLGHFDNAEGQSRHRRARIVECDAAVAEIM